MKKNHKLGFFKGGFSLIELLVVISIIGGLAALLVTNLVGVRGRASDASLKNDLNQLKTSLRLYYNDYQQYPDALNGVMLGCGSEGISACAQGETFSAGAGPTVYMQKLPSSFTYAVSTDNENFVLATVLNNLSDADIGASAERCGQTGVASAAAYYVCSN